MSNKAFSHRLAHKFECEFVILEVLWITFYLLHLLSFDSSSAIRDLQFEASPVLKFSWNVFPGCQQIGQG